jgi:hypothetical protein
MPLKKKKETKTKMGRNNKYYQSGEDTGMLSLSWSLILLFEVNLSQQLHENSMFFKQKGVATLVEGVCVGGACSLTSSVCPCCELKIIKCHLNTIQII